MLQRPEDMAGAGARVAVVSLNPGVDRTLYLPGRLRAGEVNRPVREETFQGSKGANVAVMLHRLHADVRYLAFTGGAEGARCESFARGAGVPAAFVPTAAGVRVNVKLVEPDGRTTECNPRGGPVSEGEFEALREALFSRPFGTLVLSGSLPEGLAPDTYARLCRDARRAFGARCAVDCTGRPLEMALDAGADLVKPNREELCELLDAPPGEDVGVLLDGFAARWPSATVLLTCGAEGAFLGSPEGRWAVNAARVPVKGTVGAGDACLAGYAAARGRGEPLPDALLAAAAAATAKIMLVGTTFPEADAVEAARAGLTVRAL